MNRKAVILVSGRGSHMFNIIKHVKDGKLDLDIVKVFSNKKNPPAFEKAEEYNIKTEFLSSKITRFEEKLSEYIDENGIEFIILAGFMRVLSEKFTSKYKNQVINVHPSLLPDFPGLNAQQQAWESGVKKTGVTVHYVDKGVDTGPIIYQQEFKIDKNNTFEEFCDRLLKFEHKIFIKALQKLTV